jgi:polysaccharide export outer membrane protein
MRYLSVLLVALGLQSCVTHEELVNFTEAAFPLDSAVLVSNATELRVQPLDLLHITVSSFDPEAAAPFNPQQGMGGQNMMQMQMGGIGGGGSNGMELFQGYFVDGQGMIDFPVLGRVPVAGKTIDQVKDDLYSRIQPYLNDASINVRYLNLKISVLGEVRAPGVLRLSNPRTTLLEAISIAGDLTPYANRRNILLIREIDGQRTFTRIDLQRRDFIDSPYYYLRQNDVVYVEPIQAKVATVADPVQRVISYSSGVLSIITFILALTR